MKKITLLVVLLAAFSMLVSCFGGLGVPQKKVHTQEASDQVLASDEVSIVVSSDGFSKDEAVKTALRSAIEQTFGAFVSSNTTILNDQLVNDEIVSLSSGNVKSYDILTENILPNNRCYVTLRTTICMNKLVNYINSSSSSSTVEVNMDAFDKNIRLAKMNKIAEKKVLLNVINQIQNMENLFDFDLELENPKGKSDGNYVINGKVKVLYNNNSIIAFNLLAETLKQIRMSDAEVKQYEEMGLIYYIDVDNTTLPGLCLRNGYFRFSDGENLLVRCTLKNRECDFGEHSYLDFSDKLFSNRFIDYQIGDNNSMPTKLTITCEKYFRSPMYKNGQLDGSSIFEFLTDGTPRLGDEFSYNFINTILKYYSPFHRNVKAGDLIAYRNVSIIIPQNQASKYKNFRIEYKR